MISHMKLYHGTSAAILPTILERGVIPRGERKGNFSHSVESSPYAVYLTSTYPIFFAAWAASEDDSHRGAIVEIETDLLYEGCFNADEEPLEQAGRGKDGLPANWNIKRRTKHYRDRLLTTRWDWRSSLAAMGTCAYLAPIPVKAITRALVVDFKEHPRLHLAALDASTSILNYLFCSNEHRRMTNWVFGDDLGEASDWMAPFGDPPYMQEGRNGIEFVIGGGSLDGGNGISRIVSGG